MFDIHNPGDNEVEAAENLHKAYLCVRDTAKENAGRVIYQSIGFVPDRYLEVYRAYVTQMTDILHRFKDADPLGSELNISLKRSRMYKESQHTEEDDGWGVEYFIAMSRWR